MPAGKGRLGFLGGGRKDSLEPTVGGGYVAHEARLNGVSSTLEGSSPLATSLPINALWNALS